MSDEAPHDPREDFFSSFGEEPKGSMESQRPVERDTNARERDKAKPWRFGLAGFLAVTIVGGLVIGLVVRWGQRDLESLVTFLVMSYSVGNIVFFFVIVGKMFENDMATMAWTCLVLTCLLWGPLLVFAVGWFYSGQWNCKNWMLAWTIWIAAGLLAVFSRAVF